VSELTAEELISLCYLSEEKRPESFFAFEQMLPALEREHPEWVKAYRKLRKAEARFQRRTRELRAIANDMES
jgi:alkylhydroperoxidase/carboxymuconolactone decarboxylase family protein YurZ